MTAFANQRVLVTGGGGFLGRRLVARLRSAGAVVSAPRSAQVDLTRREDVERCLAETRPQLVIHAAARVGGIGANRLHPGTYFRDNALMGIHLLEACRARGDVDKVVVLGTICAYPKLTPIPFREENLWNGYPEETNAPYGVAKKALLVMLQAYREEFGTNGVYLLPVNLYGPEDNFDPVTSHVIPAMVRKFVEARERGEKRVTLWGDGSPTREFLYVEDAAEGILAAAERYEGADPVNLGSGQEIAMTALADLVKRLAGFEGEVVWDRTKPNGQPRRKLDTSRAKERFGWEAKTPLEEGLRKTLEWYVANHAPAPVAPPSSTHA